MSIFERFRINELVWCLLLGLCVTPLLTASANESKTLKPPFLIPISLQEIGAAVDVEVRISEHLIYEYFLRFSFRENDQADRARVRALTGSHETDKAGKALYPGVSTPVALRINRIENGVEQKVYFKTIDPILTSWGGGFFDKKIGLCDLEPGVYKVRLEVLEGAPQFSGTPVSFVIGYDKYKTTFKPQSDRSKSCPQ